MSRVASAPFRGAPPPFMVRGWLRWTLLSSRFGLFPRRPCIRFALAVFGQFFVGKPVVVAERFHELPPSDDLDVPLDRVGGDTQRLRDSAVRQPLRQHLFNSFVLLAAFFFGSFTVFCRHFVDFPC